MDNHHVIVYDDIKNYSIVVSDHHMVIMSGEYDKVIKIDDFVNLVKKFNVEMHQIIKSSTASGFKLPRRKIRKSPFEIDVINCTISIQITKELKIEHKDHEFFNLFYYISSIVNSMGLINNVDFVKMYQLINNLQYAFNINKAMKAESKIKGTS